MTRIVPCPECHRPAHVLDSFVLQRPTGPVGDLRVQCEGPLSFLVSVEEMSNLGEKCQPPASTMATRVEQQELPDARRSPDRGPG
jgi:hypothetical protein